MTWRSNEPKSWFFEKINKIDRRLTQLSKTKIGLSRIRNEQGNIAADKKKIQNISKECFKNLHSTELENLKEMDEFLDAAEPLKLNQKKPTI